MLDEGKTFKALCATVVGISAINYVVGTAQEIRVDAAIADEDKSLFSKINVLMSCVNLIGISSLIIRIQRIMNDKKTK